MIKDPLIKFPNHTRSTFLGEAPPPIESLADDSADRRGGQTFPKSTDFRNSVPFRPFFGSPFRCFSVHVAVMQSPGH